MNSLLDKVALASSLDVSADDLDALGHIKEYRPPVFGPYFESAAVIQSVDPQSLLNHGPASTSDEFEIGIMGGWCPGGSWSDGVCKPFSNNRTHWMSTYTGVRNLPIDLAILPGTHNSGFDEKAQFAPTSEVCQDVSPHEQLNAGIRVLDIRVHHYAGYLSGDPRRFMIYHSTTNGRTIQGDIINGIKSFHFGSGWDRRREIVIVNFHQFRKFTQAAHAELIGILKSAFGDSIISPTYKNLSVSQIWGLPGFKNVVVSYNAGERDPSFWPGVNQCWIGSNTPSDSALKEFIDKVGKEVKPAGELRSIQAARMVFPFFVPKDISGSLMSWFAAGNAHSPIMKYYIINTDWSLRHRLVDNIIYSNQFRARTLGLQDVEQAHPTVARAKSLPSARHMLFRISDEHWSPTVSLPPILSEESHRLLVRSDASAECVLDMRNSDVPMARVTLSAGDAVAFVCLDGSEQWKLQVRDCSPDDHSYSIPAPCDGEKFVRYTVSYGNYLPLVYLPAVAAANGVVLVVSEAPYETRICHARGADEIEHVISAGQTLAFTYDEHAGGWSMEPVLTNATSD